MTVRELIDVLGKMDPDRIVVLQKDAEGNGYSPLACADDNAGYTAETKWYGEVDLQHLTEEYIQCGFCEEDLCDEDAIPCVVLVPVN